jgi:GMC oxidoreductase
MGRDPMSVVDGNLKVYGIENLRIAGGSIMPRISTGNTMAPWVVIGERCAEILKTDHLWPVDRATPDGSRRPYPKHLRERSSNRAQRVASQRVPHPAHESVPGHFSDVPHVAMNFRFS